MPTPRHSVEELKHREYLTPNEAARVFGRADDFYRGLYRERRIQGYTHTVHRATLSLAMLYLKTESIRAYLDSLCGPVADIAPRPLTQKEAEAIWNRRQGIAP